MSKKIMTLEVEKCSTCPMYISTSHIETDPGPGCSCCEPTEYEVTEEMCILMGGDVHTYVDGQPVDIDPCCPLKDAPKEVDVIGAIGQLAPLFALEDGKKVDKTQPIRDLISIVYFKE